MWVEGQHSIWFPAMSFLYFLFCDDVFPRMSLRESVSSCYCHPFNHHYSFYFTSVCSWILHIHELLPLATIWWQTWLLLSETALPKSVPQTGFLLRLCVWLEHVEICMLFHLPSTLEITFTLGGCSGYHHVCLWLLQGSSRTAEEKEKEQRGGEGEERDERPGGGPQGSAARAMPSGPNLPAPNRVRNGPDPTGSAPAPRVPQSGE